MATSLKYCAGHLTTGFTAFLFLLSPTFLFANLWQAPVLLSTMQLFAIFAALCVLLAGRALAFSISVAGVGNLTATEFLTISDSALQTACNDTCGDARSAVATCGDDGVCLCNNATATAIFNCEQCMFWTLIAEHRAMPEPLAGSQPALTAYATACAANGTNVNVPANLTKLVLPPGWNGPEEFVLSPGTTAVTLIAALLLGGGAIAVVNSM